MIDLDNPLLLGSASPRRLDILRTLRVPTVATPARADETPRAAETPATYLERVVAEKLAWAAAHAPLSGFGGVLVADTVVLLDNEILGKPMDVMHARHMLQALSGRSHQVQTRFAIAAPHAPGTALHAQTVTSVVCFRPLTSAEIAGYAATGEGLDKAGGYAVQGIGSFAVRRIEGSYGNVVGLPACEVIEALCATGLLASFPT